MSRRAAGLAVELGGRRFFVPADRVGFVVPLGADAGRSLEMPRGSVPIIDLAGRLGIPPAAPLRCAVAVAHGDDYLAFGVESVDLVYEGDPAVPELLSLDPG